jgi:hypothetical protein
VMATPEGIRAVRPRNHRRPVHGLASTVPSARDSRTVPSSKRRAERIEQVGRPLGGFNQ